MEAENRMKINHLYKALEQLQMNNTCLANASDFYVSFRNLRLDGSQEDTLKSYK